MGIFGGSFGKAYAIRGENLELLLVTQFPNSVAATHWNKCLDWRVSARVVTNSREELAIDSSAPYKSPGMDEIFPDLLQEGWRIVVPYLVKIFRGCLVTGYVPAIWRQVKVPGGMCQTLGECSLC